MIEKILKIKGVQILNKNDQSKLFAGSSRCVQSICAEPGIPNGYNCAPGHCCKDRCCLPSTGSCFG